VPTTLLILLTVLRESLIPIPIFISVSAVICGTMGFLLLRRVCAGEEAEMRSRGGVAATTLFPHVLHRRLPRRDKLATEIVQLPPDNPL
jgi:hypothetical protein